MHLYPSRSSFHVAVAGVGLMTVGAATRNAPVVAFGGAMLLAVAMGRAAAWIGVARLRDTGFAMTWSTPENVHRVPRGGTIVVRAELRNDSHVPVRVSALRPIASSFLSIALAPSTFDLPPRSRTAFDVTITAPRVGRWGVHGIVLLVSVTPFGAEGLYETPLQFSNPLGIEVLPASLSALSIRPVGGRARRGGDVALSGRSAGDGNALRELREYAVGDPFKRIAWKASARRGRLLVRETEHGDPDVVWLVVDASVELWAGAAGRSPMDRVVDQVAATAAAYLRHGDRVGLATVASRVRAWIAPASAASQAARIGAALADAAGAVDADRSQLPEEAVATRVAAHGGTLEGRPDAWRPQDLDALAARAEQLRSRAPFSVAAPFALSPRDRTLRHYMASFGIESPPRREGERENAEITLREALRRIAIERPSPSVVHVWAPAPARSDLLSGPVASLRAHRIRLRWSLPPMEHAFESAADGEDASTAALAEDAVRARTRAARQRGERMLRRMGVRVVSSARRAPVESIRASDDEPAGGGIG